MYEKNKIVIPNKIKFFFYKKYDYIIFQKNHAIQVNFFNIRLFI